MSVKIGRIRVKPVVGGEKDRTRERWRGSRHDRGYGADWTRIRDAYKSKAHGQCEECRRRGYLTVCDVIDHMIPIEDAPELRLEMSNLDALCHRHHNGWKRRLEEYARKTGAILMLPQWIKFPETRPAHFHITKFGPLKELFDAEDRCERSAQR